ncbi:signal peptidase complex subunit 3-like [Uranotaenia lowii]|uniref:signal peptidase complex subunit 3-like n=1 Tax=Uranotaenia lowii TaxID=190385 RepID=UPI00247A85E3|nr:signal peptidase complex subunit 3-like [Uranotaenia lowii]
MSSWDIQRGTRRECKDTLYSDTACNYTKNKAKPVRFCVVIRVSIKSGSNVPDFSATFLTFDLNADLNTLFNWSVKQLFLYLAIEYQTELNELNQVDKIILRSENGLLDFKNMINKYYFWDDGNGLKGHQNVTTTLS